MFVVICSTSFEICLTFLCICLCVDVLALIHTCMFVCPRMIKQTPKLKLAVKALIASAKPIGNIVLICCVLFFFFGILGVQVSPHPLPNTPHTHTHRLFEHNYSMTPC